MSPRLELIDTPDPHGKEAAGAALYAYNIGRTGVGDRRSVAALARDPTTGEVIGGFWGRTELGLLFLDMFLVPDTRATNW